MRELPIIFTGPSIPAIQAGRKTETRRLVKYIPEFGAPDDWCPLIEDPKFLRIAWDWKEKCPYGQPGDRLWVREKWRLEYDEGADLHYARFAADSRRQLTGEGSMRQIERAQWRQPKGPGTLWMTAWKSSRYMPRWASRMLLEVEEVRVERLQEITEEGAVAEGTQAIPVGEVPRPAAMSEREDFSRLWNSLHENHRWIGNPWVWVVVFKLLLEGGT